MRTRDSSDALSSLELPLARSRVFTYLLTGRSVLTHLPSPKDKTVTKKRWNAKRLTYDERKAAVASRKEEWLAKIEKGEVSVA